ncbi:MAG: 1-acyl-sn-glycerol-3-phosphate acyltransferase [Bacteroidales bacterium]|nr:1-acyl-sn-glycerol-3-phosphate acyltransferase [Bacteroidales bacterium]
MAVITAKEAAKDLSPIFAGKGGRLLFRIMEKATGIDKVNATHDRVDAAGIPFGPDFAKAILDDVGVDFRIGHAERLEALPDGPFITVSNHIYGHLDGICLVDLVGHRRPDFKVMVNEMLMWIKGLAPSFIAVNPKTDDSGMASPTSINGIKQSIQLLQEGHPLGLFPSGAVADLKPREHWAIRERAWQNVAVRLIRKARVPVVPIRFFDRNSLFYYGLELIDYKVRFIRLFHEMYNKRGTCPRVGIGPVISLEEQDRHDSLEAFGDFLRSRVDGMPEPETYIKRSELWK